MPDDYITLESGLIVPAHVARTRVKPTCVDLFCGCGGMSCGIISAGMEVVAAVDNDYVAAHTYLHNLGSYPCEIHGIEPGDREGFSAYLEKEFRKGKPGPNGILKFDVCGSGWMSHHPEATGVGHFFIGDIRKLTGRRILQAVGLLPGELDLVCGGPPCQGFSLSNRDRRPTDPRNSLVFEFVRLVIEMQPRTMVMENVPQMAKMLTPWGTTVIDEIALRLQAGGWATAEGVKKMLSGDTNARAAIRRPQKPKRRKAESQQLDLPIEATA